MESPSERRGGGSFLARHWGKLPAALVVSFAALGFLFATLIGCGGTAPPPETGSSAEAKAASGPTLWTCSMHPQVLRKRARPVSDLRDGLGARRQTVERNGPFLECSRARRGDDSRRASAADRRADRPRRKGAAQHERRSDGDRPAGPDPNCTCQHQD